MFVSAYLNLAGALRSGRPCEDGGFGSRGGGGESAGADQPEGAAGDAAHSGDAGQEGRGDCEVRRGRS